VDSVLPVRLLQEKHATCVRGRDYTGRIPRGGAWIVVPVVGSVPEWVYHDLS